MFVKVHKKIAMMLILLGCVIVFPLLADVVNRGIRWVVEPPPSLRCCVVRGSHGVSGKLVTPLYAFHGSTPKILVLDPMLGWVDPPKVLCMIFAHVFGSDGFRSMVLGASAYINTCYNIERNIMKNQPGSPGFGI